MPVKLPPHRDKFIDQVVDLLQDFAKKQGYLKISKETLSYVVQRYSHKYKTSKLPKKFKKSSNLLHFPKKS